MRKQKRPAANRRRRILSPLVTNCHPTLGIMVWPSRISRLQKGEPDQSIQLAAIAARQLGVNLYFFCLKDVNLKSRSMLGWQQQTGGYWTQATVPWPDVFHPATRIKTSNGKLVMAEMSRHSQPINSRDILGKWEVHLALHGFSDMHSYLPETMQFTCWQDLAAMLRQHKSVLAKPAYGLGAMNISKIWNMGPDLYGWEDSSTGTQLTNLNFDAMLAKVVENAGGPFVVQEELSILETAHRRNKIRVIMNKDGTGTWRQSLSYAFIGQEGQFAVSRHQGAAQMPLRQGLRMLGIGGFRIQAICRELTKLSFLAVTHLDRVLGPMGEIGLDLAIGKDDRVWLIEANARPNKNNLPFQRKSTLLRPFILMMQYATHLWQRNVGQNR